MALLENPSYGYYHFLPNLSSCDMSVHLFDGVCLSEHQVFTEDKVAVKREEAVTLDMNKRLADDKKMSKKEKDERILWKKNEVADYEATTFSIFYNNALFLALIIFASFYILRSFSPAVNYVLSVSAAGGLLALVSTGTQ